MVNESKEADLQVWKAESAGINVLLSFFFMFDPLKEDKVNNTNSGEDLQ